MTHSGDEIVHPGEIRVIGQTQSLELAAVQTYRSVGRRLVVKPKTLGGVYDSRVEISVPDEADDEIAVVMLSALREAGYEARLYLTSAHTAEVDPQ